jgi:ABC-2 type transport system ATP-binding protein
MNLLTETLDLQDLLHTPVRQLSLGQRMRCELAASLIHSPKILFLDEPTIGLDAISKLAVRQFIKKYNEEKNLTVILTTHDMSDIEALANRLILIGKGHLLFDGKLSDLRERYSMDKTMTIDHGPNSTPLHIEGTTLISQTLERTVLSVDTKLVSVSDVIGEVSRRMDLTDVSVTAQPIEELIVQLYKEYQI